MWGQNLLTSLRKWRCLLWRTEGGQWEQEPQPSKTGGGSWWPLSPHSWPQQGAMWGRKAENYQVPAAGRGDLQLSPAEDAGQRNQPRHGEGTPPQMPEGSKGRELRPPSWPERQLLLSSFWLPLSPTPSFVHSLSDTLSESSLVQSRALTEYTHTPPHPYTQLVHMLTCVHSLPDRSISSFLWVKHFLEFLFWFIYNILECISLTDFSVFVLGVTLYIYITFLSLLVSCCFIQCEHRIQSTTVRCPV